MSVKHAEDLIFLADCSLRPHQNTLFPFSEDMQLKVKDEPILNWLSDNGFSCEQPLLSANSRGQQALILAAQQSRADVLEFLLLQGAEVNVVDRYGNNALWAACFAETLDCAALLLEAGIHIDYQNPSGATALIYSASSGKSVMVRQLLQAGANPELATQDDFSALDLAATLECLKLLRQAIKNGKAQQ